MSAADELRGLLRMRGLQLLILATLLAVVGWRSMQLKFAIIDLDTWWHLKVGEWIVEHHGVPHSGILSRTAAERPWVAYSWGYEVLLSRFYAWFGLIGIGVFGTLLTLAVAYSVYWMARRLSGHFWMSCLLATIACSAFLFDLAPRPVFLSMVLFTITLTLILEAQRKGRMEGLYWLPLIFLAWANLHIQFLYGLFLVGLLCAVTVVSHFGARLKGVRDLVPLPALPIGRVAGVFGACVLATLIGPYSYRLYVVIVEYSRAKVSYSIIAELQPMSFRAYDNYAVLFLAAAAFYMAGQQKKIDLFKLLLLVIAAVVAFRTIRDAWFLCVSAAGCIAAAVEHSDAEEQDTRLETGGVLAAVALALLLSARATQFTSQGFDRMISSDFPVHAVNYLRRSPAPGPLYNTFDWGGFLMWYMPQYPVAIDGRNDLYGDELDGRFVKIQKGDPLYKTDPLLNDAGVVLLRRTDGLVAELELDSRFRKVYEDQIAAVFVRQ